MSTVGNVGAAETTGTAKTASTANTAKSQGFKARAMVHSLKDFDEVTILHEKRGQ